MYALVKEDLASLDWLDATRRNMTLVDALGNERSHVSVTSR
jgi:hypothetical protein